MSPAPAAAGAWIAPEGGQHLTTTAAGQREDETPYYEGATYSPVATDTSVVFAPWFESNHLVSDGWRGEAVFGFKHAFYRTGESVMALQAGALWVSNPDEGCSEGGAELRFLAGRSFAGGRAFANVETGVRALSGGCEGGRVEVSAGYRPRENWLAAGQVFMDAPVEGDDSLKVQVSEVRFGRSGMGIQLGVRARTDGGEPEPAVVLGLWAPPRD